MQTFAGLLEHRGLSLRALAKLASISPTMLSQASRGLRNLSDGSLARVAMALAMSPSDVLEILSAGTEQDSERDRRQRYEAQWEHQLRHLRYSFSVDHSMRAMPQPDGRIDVLLRRHVRECLPLEGAVVPLVTARDRAITKDSRHGHGALPHVLREPACRMDTQVTVDAGWRVARFTFPDGWRREDGPLEYTLETMVEGGLLRKAQGKAIVPIIPEIPPRVGSFAFTVRASIDHLTLEIDMDKLPAEELPKRWLGAWSWWDTISVTDVTGNLIDAGTCRSYKTSSTPTSARLEVEAPLAGYSFATLWEE